MRRNHFFTMALVALSTFVALSAFSGRGHWNRHSGWRHGHCYNDNRYRDDDRENIAPQPGQGSRKDSANTY